MRNSRQHYESEKLKLNELFKQKEELRKASDIVWEREGREKENKAIEKSGLTPTEYFRKRAVKEFRTTTDFNEAGFRNLLCPAGRKIHKNMLYYSGTQKPLFFYGLNELAPALYGYVHSETVCVGFSGIRFAYRIGINALVYRTSKVFKSL